MNTLLSILYAFLLSTVILLAFFIVIMKLKRFTDGRPEWVRTATVLGWWPVIGLGILWDVFFQFTWGTLIFWELPESREWLLSSRLQRHKASGSGWRYKRAVQLCRLVEWVDPGHCK